VEEKFAEIGRGAVVYICFLKGASPAVIEQIVKFIMNAKLCYNPASKKNDAQLPEIQGDLLLVPQASLGGKLKGKAFQYYSLIGKEEGANLYQGLIQALIKLSKEQDEGISADAENRIGKVRYGTYGNQQALQFNSLGPFTHTVEF